MMLEFCKFKVSSASNSHALIHTIKTNYLFNWWLAANIQEN